MTGKQRAVLWIGLIIIGLNLVGRWSDIVSVIFSGAGTPSPSNGSGSNKPSIQVPIDPVLPTGPKITIPLQASGSFKAV